MPAAGDITIRKAAAADAGTIHALTRALAGSIDCEHEFSSRAEDFAQHGFSAAPRFTALLAERGGSAVGLCLFFPTFSSWRGQPGIYVQDLYVSEQARGTGTGRALLAEAIRLASLDGATHVRLCVDHQNVAAQDFYLAIGMRFRDDEQVYEADGDAFRRLGAAKS